MSSSVEDTYNSVRGVCEAEVKIADDWGSGTGCHGRGVEPTPPLPSSSLPADNKNKNKSIRYLKKACHCSLASKYYLCIGRSPGSISNHQKNLSTTFWLTFPRQIIGPCHLYTYLFLCVVKLFCESASASTHRCLAIMAVEEKLWIFQFCIVFFSWHLLLCSYSLTFFFPIELATYYASKKFAGPV